MFRAIPTFAIHPVKFLKMLVSVAKRSAQVVSCSTSLKQHSFKPVRNNRLNKTINSLSLASNISYMPKNSSLVQKPVFRYYSASIPTGSEHSTTENANITGDGKKIYTRREVSEHNTKSDGWVIINSKVYNVTSWIEYHPGGENVLLEKLGMDATQEFTSVGHSHKAMDILDSLHIGHVTEKRRYTGL